ncbi:tRNA lysidine(34) synthetase TilS, partial [Treponema sp.]|uniref:tRNA lysidine(34) synthetase TilS n=1 Tax=Treponema sp. TaxID=166 RepID=UPI003890F6C2
MQKNTDNYFPLAKLKNLNSFERKVLEGLVFCGISEKTVSKSTPLGIAVSGGADSVSLLLSLNAIFGNENICVITIDHGIRSEEESGGDAAFVEQLCKNYKISCEILKIPYGEISKKSAETKKSIEETARVFRYNFFESFIRQKNLCNLALAHNQNDQTETLLMRFLQGSSTEGMGGIERVRGKFIRPLLDISRDEIEVYLTEKNQKWRTDATNFDIKYFRNKIRNVLVPFLNENFTGWHKPVLMAAKKTKDDEDFIKNCCPVNRYDSTVNRDFFYSLHDSLKRRVFFSALNKAGFGGRFPFKLFEEVLQWQNKKTNKISYENL